MSHPLFRNIRGRTPQNGRYNSKLERTALVHWLARYDVESAELNAYRATYRDIAGVARRYLADIVVRWKCGVDRRPFVVECKFQQDLDSDPALGPKHSCIAEAVAAQGYDFRIMTEAQVYTADLAAKEFIVGHRNDPPSPFDDEVMASVRAAGCISLGRALAGLRGVEAERLHLVPVFWRLVAVGRLFVSYGPQPMGDATFVHASPVPLPEP